MFGWTMMSGVRGSPFGGNPGGLNICAIPGPEKISPIPAMLFVAGEVLPNVCTAFVVCEESDSQSSEMSSSVGPICGGSPIGLPGGNGCSDGGRRASRIPAGEVVIGLPDGTPMPRYRLESIGLWPCLAEMTINVDW